MASRECDICEEHAYDLGASEPLPDNLDREQLQSLPEEDGEYMETSMTGFEREEYARGDIALFLKEFPAQREEIDRCIHCLLEMADVIDETHKKCTIASITANSTSAASGILTILGMTLAPFTAGGSLILTAAGLGLGAVATATGLSASMCESVRTSKEMKKAQELMTGCGRSLQMAMGSKADFSPELPPNNDTLGENFKNLVSTVAGKVPDAYKAVKGIKTNVETLKSVRANPGLKALAKQMTAAGSASRGAIQGTKQAKKAFAGTTLAMTKGARLLSTATAGVFLLFDAYNIAQDAKHLTEGAKAEKATEIRDRARKLEAELQEFNQLYEELKDKL
ncbi:apolipoprotein L3-like [Tiliqua scincoides]|uniref:apolipoprotein L3-like n=1 Tax=Tiliqua scincoides TaxID=71010 RepID=UPI0034636C48